MVTFLIVAAVMAAIAAAVVATPLLRDRPSRLTGVAAALCVLGAAAALYPLWSNWHWHAATGDAAAGPDVMAMVAKLEGHLRDQPDDYAGWMMLGRSYLALERLDDAIVAYDHVHRLDANNADAALGLGEAISLRAGGNITPPAAALFEQALVLAPDSPKALLYAGFAALARGDTAAARSRWLALKAFHPPEAVEQMLDAKITELDRAGPPVGEAAGSATSVANTAVRGAGAPDAAATGVASVGASAATASVTIHLAPSLKSHVTKETALFIFAREAAAPGPPLAAKRLTTAAIGSQVDLSAADSMIAARHLSVDQHVTITARVSFSGQPLPAAGDLYGEVIYYVGHDMVRDLVIDRIAE